MSIGKFMLEEMELGKGRKVFRDEAANVSSHILISMDVRTNLPSCIFYPKFSALKQHK